MGSKRSRHQPVVLCVGLTTLDLAQSVDHVPAANQKVQSTSARLDFGGPAANAAATAAYLGSEARLVTALGFGSVAGIVGPMLSSAGIETRDVARPPWDTPISSIMITRGTGERAVVSHNAVQALVDERAASEIDLQGVDCLLVDGHLMPLAIRLAERARSLRIPVVMDGGSYKPDTEELLGSVSLALVSEDFSPPDCGPDPEDVLRWIEAQGSRWAAMSRGARSILLSGRDEGVAEVPVDSSGPVIDTLGAGDVLHGALAAQAARGAREGRPLDRDEACRSLSFAGEVATFSTRKIGGLRVHAQASDGRHPFLGRVPQIDGLEPEDCPT